ncbi:unnamed protein product, partial [Mesorhabditis spiculigera]
MEGNSPRVFRHGARAPLYEFSSNESTEFYFRGVGQLSDLGLVQGMQLGELFNNRYVRTGFLHHGMKPSEVYFRSSPKERCLMTAQEVGRGMFRRDIAVPVFTFPTREEDVMLYPRMECPHQTSRNKEIFGADTFEEAFDRIRDVYAPSRTEDKGYLEAVKIEKFEGLPVPEWANTKQGLKELEDTFYEYLTFICGTGRLPDPETIQTKSGLLLHTIHLELQRSWSCHTVHRFLAYSTHDTVVLPLAESLGLIPAFKGHLPHYATGFIFELWNRDGEPFVKVFYRFSPSSHEVTELTGEVRNCADERCTLDQFVNCCDEFKTDDPLVVCGMKKGFCWKSFFLWTLLMATILLLTLVIALLFHVHQQRKK